MNKELRDAVYFLQHRLLPKFFENTGFLEGLLPKNDTFIYDLLTEICTDHKIENPFHKEDFSVETCHISEIDCYIAIINFPEPEEPLLCSEIYLLFDKSLSHRMFFTVEKSYHVAYCLCGWSEGMHNNYGSINPEDALKKALQIYLKS